MNTLYMEAEGTRRPSLPGTGITFSSLPQACAHIFLHCLVCLIFTHL